MTRTAHDQYPANPTSNEALRFMDSSVEPSEAFRDRPVVKYRDGQTLRFEQPQDAFYVGYGGPTFANEFSPFVITTSKARYYADADTFARQESGEAAPGQKKPIQAFERDVLGDGLSGRVEQPIMLPGATDPEVVKSIELDYKPGNIEDTESATYSPFHSSDLVLESAHYQLIVEQGVDAIKRNNN